MKTQLAKLISLALLFSLVGVSCAACTAPVVKAQKCEPDVVERAFKEAAGALSFFCKGCSNLQLVQSEATSYAAVVTTTAGDAYVIYNRAAMEQVMRAFGYDAVVAIFGHEIGHVIVHRSGAPMGGPAGEAAADFWAGCAIGVARSSPEPILRLMRSWGSDNPNYPTAEERQFAVTEGYLACYSMLDGA
jgi:hypothetical protein